MGASLGRRGAGLGGMTAGCGRMRESYGGFVDGDGSARRAPKSAETELPNGSQDRRFPRLRRQSCAGRLG